MPDASALIIDDEAGIVRLCKRLLERANYAVSTYTDPVAGAEALRQEQFDLLLVDIRMPELDGFKVIDVARQTQPDIAVVIMTGFGTLETAIHALRQGADGLILKPFEEGEELVKTVREALKERQHKKEMARLRAIRPLLDMTETMFSETRRSALIDLVLNAMLGNMRCSHAAIYEKKPGENVISLIGSRGTYLPEEHSRANSGLVGRSDHWKVPIWVNSDGPGDPELQTVLQEHNLGAVICTPVERGEGSLVFMAGRDQGEPGFQLADLETFGLLARQADVALENARLYGELREYLNQVEASQRALIQAEKMSAVGRLTASIAHEVNNPLQSVSNCLHLVGREELGEKEKAEYLNLAQEEMERLMGTVQRMLDFYRPGKLNRELTDVNELIERVFTLLEKQLSNNNTKIQKKFGKKLPPVLVVSNQLQQVFFNLSLNAMEAMPDGGTLEVSTRRNGKTVEIDFQDSGEGVPKEIRDNIFEPFLSTRDERLPIGSHSSSRGRQRTFEGGKAGNLHIICLLHRFVPHERG